MGFIKSFCFLVILFPSASCLGQDYLGSTKKEVFKSMSLEVEDTTDNFEWEILDSSDAIRVMMTGHQKIIQTFYFNGSNVCDSILIQLHCSECVDRNIEGVLGSTRRRNWHKVDSNNYISPNWLLKRGGGKYDPPTYTVMKMTVKRTPKEPICATVYFHTVDGITKKERRSIKRGTYQRSL